MVAIDYTRGNDFAYIQDVNHRIANELFPDRDDRSMFLKMYGELAEMVEDPSGEDEIADALILILDHASRHNINAAHAVLTKLGVNVNREWQKTQSGTYQHVEKPA